MPAGKPRNPDTPWSRALWLLPALVLGLLVVTVWRERGVDPAQHAVATAALIEVRRLDTEINQSALQLRHGMQRNYDHLADVLVRLVDQTQLLVRPETGLIGVADAALHEEITALATRVAEKVAIVEEFKRANAGLAFAVGFFPEAVRQFRLAVHAPGLPMSALEVETLLDSVQRLNESLAWGNSGAGRVPDGAGQEAERRIASLKRLAEGLRDAELQDQVRLLTGYATLIHKQGTRADDRLMALTGSTVGDEALRLHGHYLDRYGARERAAQGQRAWLYGLSALLVLYVLAVLIRLGYTARSLRETLIALGDVEERQRVVLETMDDGVVTIDERGTIESLNPAVSRIFGYAREDLVGRNVSLLMDEPHRSAHDGYLAHYLATGERRIIGVGGREVPARRADGSVFPLELRVSEIRVAGRRLFSGVLRDISARKRAEEELGREKELAQVTLQSIADAVITTDAAQHIVYLNPVAEDLTGWTLAEARGRPLGEVFHVTPPAGSEATAMDIDPVARCLETGQPVSLPEPYLLHARGGDELAVEEIASPIRLADGAVHGAVLVFRDITEQRRLQSRLVWQATHDSLTGLINRTEFQWRLEAALDAARAADREAALLYLDLDQFKVVNDTCGHVAGDELLRQLSAVLKRGVRDADTLARLGGDEFGVLLDYCAAADARSVAEKLLEAVNGFRFVWEGRAFDIGASIGLVSVGGDLWNDAAAVMAAADVACYAAKERGRNRIHEYRPDDRELSQRQGEMRWVSEITAALAEDRLEFYAQPIVPIGAGRSRRLRYELLIRMRDREGRMVSPGAFIPAAERYGLMGQIDRWVVRNALLACPTCMIGNPDRPQLSFSINLSGVSLSDKGLVEFVRAEIERSGVPPDTITFEITETAAIANLSDAMVVIENLRALGCSFALDDFGSGLSSFAYLKNLPVDYLKIDGSFIRGIAGDPIHRAMVEAINNVGHTMGLKTVAEFVEDAATFACLKEIGVDFAQGYGVGEPRPLEDVLVALWSAAAASAKNKNKGAGTA